MIGGLVISSVLLTIISNTQGVVPDSANQSPVLTEAVREASRRLEHKNCAAFFGPGAHDALLGADYRIISLGPPRSRATHRDIAVAATLRENRMIVINRDGPFMNPKTPILGTRYRTVVPGLILSDKEFRALVILHELGHLVQKFGPDSHDTSESQGHSARVLFHCF